MATETTNYKLIQPAEEDFYDVNVQNDNMQKIDVVLKTNESNIEKHRTDSAVHVTRVEKAAWNSKLNKVENITEGNFPKINKDGSISDSGKSAASFVNAEHESAKVASANGVHGIRYYNKKMQVGNNTDGWADVLDSVLIQLQISVATGSDVTVSDGITTLTGIAENDTISFALPNYGTWNISASLNGQSTSATLDVDTNKLYTVSLSYFSSTIEFTTIGDATIYRVRGAGPGADAIAIAKQGIATYTATKPGQYTFFSRYNAGQGEMIQSKSVTLNVTESHYSVQFDFITLTVNVTVGSTVTVSNGSNTYTKLGTGSDVFYLPSMGTWTISASLSGKTASGTVNVSAYTSYAISLNYYIVYGVSINLTDSVPSNVTYTDDAIGMVGGSSDWDSKPIFKDIKPCWLLLDGHVTYLNLDDFGKYLPGNLPVADPNGYYGDIMIEIPKIGYKIVTNDKTLTVQITDNPNASSDGFRYYAHTRTTEGDRDKLYVGAYLGFVKDGKLRSLTGKEPSNMSLNEFRTAARNMGDGYDVLSFHPLTLLQCLFLIKYKNRDSQTALGKGNVNGSKMNTGSTDTKGMYYGSTDDAVPVKFAGIEDFWGNLNCLIDGLATDGSWNLYTATDNFNDDKTGYTNRGEGSYRRYGSMVEPMGTTELGFISKVGAGSTTTYFPDNAGVDDDSCAYFGGHFGSRENAGAFSLSISTTPGSVGTAYGARLMYL